MWKNVMRPISPTWPTKFKANAGDKTLSLEIQCDDNLKPLEQVCLSDGYRARNLKSGGEYLWEKATLTCSRKKNQKKSRV